MNTKCMYNNLSNCTSNKFEFIYNILRIFAITLLLYFLVIPDYNV